MYSLPEVILDMILYDKYKRYFYLTVLAELVSFICKRKINEIFSRACDSCHMVSFKICPRIHLQVDHDYETCRRCLFRRRMTIVSNFRTFWWCPLMSDAYHDSGCPFCTKRWRIERDTTRRICFDCTFDINK